MQPYCITASHEIVFCFYILSSCRIFIDLRWIPSVYVDQMALLKTENTLSVLQLCCTKICSILDYFLYLFSRCKTEIHNLMYPFFPNPRYFIKMASGAKYGVNTLDFFFGFQDKFSSLWAQSLESRGHCVKFKVFSDFCPFPILIFIL